MPAKPLFLIVPAALAAGVAVSAVPSVRAQTPPSTFPPRRPPMPPRLPAPVNAPVVVTEEIVKSTIINGVADTEVAYLLENRGTNPNAEADFLLPIPFGATVQNFALYDGETRLAAEMLDEKAATTTYEEIVRRRRDPALLTFAGRNLLRARVFPVIAGKPRRITLKITTLLPREQNAAKFSWPLAGPHLPGAIVPERVSVRVFTPHATFYSPTLPVSLGLASGTKGDGPTATWSSEKSAGGAASLGENPEFTLYITPDKNAGAITNTGSTNAPVSLSVLTFRDAKMQVASAGTTPAPPSGYFIVVATPNPDAKIAVPPRRVVLVLDRSGSMDGKKIEQARAALRFAVGKLRPQDTFNILTFSDKVESFSPEVLSGSKENIARAQAWVEAIDASGGTNLDAALQSGLNQFSQPQTGNTLLFFTDGEPTVGSTNRAEIIRNAIKAADKRARTFVFGVGYNVDVPFLDELSQALRGDADYVRPDENIEIKTSQFVEKTRAPVLENVSLRVDGAKITDVYPRPGEVFDVFAGSQTVVVGRYTGSANDVRVSLAGESAGKPVMVSLPVRFPAQSDGAAFLPRLWASRKIGYLTASLRGDLTNAARTETTEQIKNLSKEWGILTTYTGLFVGEPGVAPASFGAMRPRGTTLDVDGFEVQSGRGGNRATRATGGGYGGGGAAAPVARSGASAVDASQSSRAQRSQNQVGNVYAYALKSDVAKQKDEAITRKLQTVGTRSFYLVNAVWTDATYNATQQKEIVKIKAFSPAYFALTRRSSDWAKWASVGDAVLISANQTQAVQFGDTGKETLTDAELNALTPTK